jgi:transcriptional regulator with PAS, ATPase and Fis domain
MIARAAGGTLLLDEFGELKWSSQVKLLRVLDDRIYYPLGSDLPKTVDNVKIVAATNRDLGELVESGTFRRDLLYRIKAHHVHIPALRERRQDIPLLASRFLEMSATSLSVKKPSLTSGESRLLEGHDYPGNVRELRAVIHNFVATGNIAFGNEKFSDRRTGSSIQDLPSPAAENMDSVQFAFDRFPTLKEAVDMVVERAMELAKGNQRIAAKSLGISRQALSKRLINKRKSEDSPK